MPRRVRRAAWILWWFAATASLAATLWTPLLAPGQAPLRLYAHASVSISTDALRRELQSHLPDVHVAVFGRLRDFQRSVRNERPDMVLASKTLLEHMALTPHIQGLSGGRDTEPYVLVTRAPLAPSAVTTATIGMVDVLGPEQTTRIAEEMLAPWPPATVRRVTKPVDLLAVLRLALAQGVLLPKRLLGPLKIGSEMGIAVRPLDHPGLGLPAVHVVAAQHRSATLSRFHGLGSNLNEELGVDQWR